MSERSILMFHLSNVKKRYPVIQPGTANFFGFMPPIGCLDQLRRFVPSGSVKSSTMGETRSSAVSHMR